jgi:uncharacterized protein (DUF1501 family)
MWSRRELLKAAASGAAVLIVPPVLMRAGAARAAGTDRVLVTIFLRGAADFLNLVVPAGDPHYYALRPKIRVAPGAELPLDGFFGLNPNLSALLPWFQSGQLAVIHACGSPSRTRSHFDEQDFVEFGAPGDKTVRNGWLNRYLVGAGVDTPIAAVTIGARAVKALAGEAVSLAIPSIASMKLSGGFVPQRRAALEQIYRAAGGPLARTVENSLDVYDTLATVDASTSVTYPSSPFASALRDLAALIKADIGVRVGAADLGGWDHHFNELEVLPGLAANFADSLHAFASDLGSDLGRTLVLVMTEFGRRAAENPSGGTDHGVAGAMLALGGGIAGGRVLLKDAVWPGLAPQELYQGVDLQPTTDFRDVFSEALDRHTGVGNLGSMFPNFSPDISRYPGLYV